MSPKYQCMAVGFFGFIAVVLVCGFTLGLRTVLSDITINNANASNFTL